MKEQISTNKKYSHAGMSNQSKTVIIGWFVISLLIFATACFVIEKTEQKITESYRSFGLVLSKTLASESINLISGSTDENKQERLDAYTKKIIADNNDIEYIEYRDNDFNTYLLIGEKSLNEDKNSFSITVPMYIGGENEGSIDVGFTGKTMAEIKNTTRNSMIIIFTVMWILALFAVLMNTLIITRQISLLADGVRRISSGEFGYKLNAKDLWGEIKLLFDEFNNMSARLRSYEEKNIDELTYEKNKLESVLMCIANGVIVCDNFDGIVLANPAAYTMLGAKGNELIGMKIQEYCDQDGIFAFRPHIKTFKETPLDYMEKQPLEFQLKIDNMVFKSLVSPIFTASQEYLGYIVVLHDITKESQIDKLKNDFISNVSHELRTPVTVLRSYIDTLCNFNNDFDDKTKGEFLQIMNQEAKRLNTMVNDILDFSRLESPNVSLPKQMCDLKSVLELSVSSMSVLAKEKNLQFVMIIEPDLPQVYINQESIERALGNLLSNAVKYSPENSKIKVRAEVDRSGNYVECSVEDFGEGIPREHLSKIFDRFYRVETKAHVVKGTGLGLHLVKVAIEKHHNGEVFVESKVGEGSKFGFRLPLHVEIKPSENEPDGQELV